LTASLQVTQKVTVWSLEGAYAECAVNQACKQDTNTVKHITKENLVVIAKILSIIKGFYLEIFRRTKANWMQREMSAYAQNPPPSSAEQW
jgi:hypothetical protein